jgi:5'-3' exoribonuclease 1
MGIHRFFPWFKTTFGEHLIPLGKNKNFKTIDIKVDNFMIDLNGIFHTSAQKIYEYGNFKPHASILNKNRRRKVNGLQQQIKVFEDVCETVETLFHIVNPQKKLILCVDGPAPQSKQKQQRQRRFKSAQESSISSHPCTFDSNSITPGTKFMDYLTKYIDFYIRKRISEDKRWQNVQVIFSNEKSPGEGEHKLLNFIRQNKTTNPDDSYCIHGLDSDLIMLSLGTHLENFYILREDQYDYNNEFFVVDIGGVRMHLIEMMRWNTEGKTFKNNYSVNDFIFLCFMVGNDFLPHIPSLEILNGGIDMMLDIYKDVCFEYGHLTRIVTGNVVFVKKPMEIILGTIGRYEKEMLEEKINGNQKYFQDILLEKSTFHNNIEGGQSVDILKYRALYYSTNFSEDVTQLNICHQYLEGMQWVLSYYTTGVSNWKWFYPYHYAPFASSMAKNVQSFRFPVYGLTIPNTPYQQLLCVLPPKSANLIPYPLNTLLTNPNSPIKKYYPDTFKVDLSGKKKEYEGVILLPVIDSTSVQEEYFNILPQVDPRDLRRNKAGKSFVYNYMSDLDVTFKSYYGEIASCKTIISTIDI